MPVRARCRTSCGLEEIIESLLLSQRHLPELLEQRRIELPFRRWPKAHPAPFDEGIERYPQEQRERLHLVDIGADLLQFPARDGRAGSVHPASEVLLAPSAFEAGLANELPVGLSHSMQTLAKKFSNFVYRVLTRRTRKV